MTFLLCGNEITADRPAASPFAKLIAFGWEDGPTTGVVRCGDCADAYRFDLLATDIDGVHDREAWDRGKELRIFALAPLPTGAFDRVGRLISSVEAPTWPTWVPGVTLQYLPQALKLDRFIETEVAPIVANADPPTLIVATAGLLQPIAAIRDYPVGQDRTPLDWFKLLGFAADERLMAST